MRISDWSSDVCSSDLAGRSIDLIECAFGPDEPLHGVDEAVAARLDSRGLIRRSHPGHGSRGLAGRAGAARSVGRFRSEEHTSELQSLMRISYAVFCLKKKKHNKQQAQMNTISTHEHNKIQQYHQHYTTY